VPLNDDGTRSGFVCTFNTTRSNCVLATSSSYVHDFIEGTGDRCPAYVSTASVGPWGDGTDSIDVGACVRDLNRAPGGTANIGSGSGTGAGSSESGGSSQSPTTLSWVLNDNCNDGRGLAARFFESENGRLTGQQWPGGNDAYVSNSGEAISVDLACDESVAVCLGAEPRGDGSTFWGLGVDGNESCQDCCAQCGSKIEENLTCR